MGGTAPLTGAFYSFEIVIGAYTPAAIAPVAAAALSAVLTARLRGLESVKDKARSVVVYTDSEYSIGCLTKAWKPKKKPTSREVV